jgi:segregation and condensation protein B
VLRIREEAHTREGDVIAAARRSRSDVERIRGIDSSGVIDTLLGRGLIADDTRYGGRGRAAFLVTSERFLQTMGLRSLNELPPRPL